MEGLGLGVRLPQNDPGFQNVISLTGGTIRRKTFSDITNITANLKSGNPEVDKQRKNVQDDIIILLNENVALMRLVDQRNKIIEKNALELQSMKTLIQQLNQQNSQLSQTNSQMLAEYNLGKDRLKAMQHELGCTKAVLKIKTAELQEEKKRNLQYKKLEKINAAVPNNMTCTIASEHDLDTFNPASCKKIESQGIRKRPLRSRSLGPVAVTCPKAAKLNDEGRRKSWKRPYNSHTTTESCEPTNEKAFQAEDTKLPNYPREEENAANNGNGDAEGNEVRRKYSSYSSPSESRRNSIGRPMRRAAEKVCTYKERPLNVKMRRD